MAPDHTTVHPLRIRSLNEDLASVMADTHTFPMNDYVVIHQCDPPCNDCEFIKVSNKEALQLSLKEEKKKNEKYREKLNDVVKKYGQSLRQIEYQKSRIEFLKRQLIDGRGRSNDSVSEFKLVAKDEYTVIEHSDDSLEDDDLVCFKNKVKLEIVTD